MTTGEENRLLYKESETPQKCVECGKETRRLVNTAEFEIKPEWTPLCSFDCESRHEDTVSGDACGFGYF